MPGVMAGCFLAANYAVSGASCCSFPARGGGGESGGYGNMSSANSPSQPQPRWRVEDEQLLRGQGRFINDAPLPGQVYGCFVRSTHAHAKIRNIDIAAARAADGVVAVLTAADMKAAGVGPVLRHPPMTGRNGAALIEPHRPALAADRVMHIGEPVALVVATTAAQAQDAAERVHVDYEELRPV